MPTTKIGLDGENLFPQLSHDLLLQVRTMLGVELQESRTQSLFDLSLDNGHQRLGQQIGVMIRNIWTKEDFLDLARQTLVLNQHGNQIWPVKMSSSPC